MARRGARPRDRSRLLGHAPVETLGREQREIDAVVSLTGRGMRELTEFFGRAGGSLVVVNNGTSFKPECPSRVETLLRGYRSRSGLLVHRGGDRHAERFSFGAGDRIVLFVGRSVPEKGIYELAEALKLVHHRSRGKVRGIFVGAFESKVRQQLSAIDPAGARDYLLFTGQVADNDVLAALYALGDATAMVSHFEAFGLSAAESYLMGTPCLVTEGTSAADAYLDGPGRLGMRIALPVARPHREGLRRFSGVDVDSLASQLHSILFDDGLARRLGEDGKAYVQHHFSYQMMGDRYLELFDRLRRTSEPVGGDAGATSRFQETGNQR